MFWTDVNNSTSSFQKPLIYFLISLFIVQIIFLSGNIHQKICDSIGLITIKFRYAKNAMKLKFRSFMLQYTIQVLVNSRVLFTNNKLLIHVYHTLEIDEQRLKYIK